MVTRSLNIIKYLYYLVILLVTMTFLHWTSVIRILQCWLVCNLSFLDIFAYFEVESTDFIMRD